MKLDRDKAGLCREMLLSAERMEYDKDELNKWDLTDVGGGKCVAFMEEEKVQ